MEEIRLEIISPKEELVNEMVELVTLPGTNGSFTVLRNHAPLISSLVPGKIRYIGQKGQSEVAVKGGFVKIENNSVVVCVEA